MKKKIDTETVTAIITLIIVIIIALGLIAWVVWVIFKPIEYTSSTYQLNELNNGAYAVYYTTHSNVPADNYEVVTLNCNGNVYTFKGHVWISYLKDNTSPYVVYEDCDIVNRDKIYVYVPEGTVEYQGSVGIK